jgi:hypothetical protein
VDFLFFSFGQGWITVEGRGGEKLDKGGLIGRRRASGNGEKRYEELMRLKPEENLIKVTKDLIKMQSFRMVKSMLVK